MDEGLNETPRKMNQRGGFEVFHFSKLEICDFDTYKGFLVKKRL
jgi:hypothetical protein